MQTGATENFKHRGIIPRAIEEIFREIRNKPENAYTVRISYLEIYNETLYDLLSSLNSSEEPPEYKVVEDGKGCENESLSHRTRQHACEGLESSNCDK